jgi:hypothetical protein
MGTVVSAQTPHAEMTDAAYFSAPERHLGGETTGGLYGLVRRLTGQTLNVTVAWAMIRSGNSRDGQHLTSFGQAARAAVRA